MPKYRVASCWDEFTNAPSSNFDYEFDTFRFFTNSSWQEVLSHDSQDLVRSGSLDDLAAAFNAGCEMKVGLSGLSNSLGGEQISHEVFVSCGPGYFHRDSQIFSVGTHPTVRVRIAVPMVLLQPRMGLRMAVCSHRRICPILALRSLFARF